MIERSDSTKFYKLNKNYDRLTASQGPQQSIDNQSGLRYLFRVLGSGFWVQGSAPPLAKKTTSLIEKETNEHSPAMHSILAWCRYGCKDQMAEFASPRVIGIAGRSNIERPTSNKVFYHSKIGFL
jgi:hypothetical protein